ncbi:MAG: lysoplasmalogenase family protein [Candidatus Kariarchaeaceae archaeon]
MDEILVLIITSYVFSLLFLTFSQLNEKKREFLISVFFILLASLISYFDDMSDIRLLFLLAICFSFIGDLFMAKIIKITKNRLINGIIGFGIAHIIYIIGFVKMQTVDQFIWWIPTLIVFLIIILFYLVGYNKDASKILMLAVFCYVIIMGMVFSSVIYLIFNPTPTLVIVFALVGVILFMISDSIISYNEFKQELPYASRIIPTTYILAQIFLQLSAYVYTIS